MIELTREELVWLEEHLRFTLQHYIQPQIVVKVHKKIQLMLESHCDHEFKKTLDKSENYFISECRKCKKVES